MSRNRIARYLPIPQPLQRYLECAKEEVSPFKVLADETRLRMMLLLTKFGRMSPAKISEQLNVPIERCRNDFAQLIMAGLICLEQTTDGEFLVLVQNNPARELISAVQLHLQPEPREKRG